jgi:hypothetical protein
MMNEIPTENVVGRIIAKIPQTKTTIPQAINHGDAFFIL